MNTPGIEAWLAEAASAVADLGRTQAGNVHAATKCILATLRNGGKVLVVGNGGSAAQAQHLAAELVVRFRRNRKAAAALALTVDGAVLTAVSNDLGADELFARQVEALGRPGDTLVALSTSGRSANVLAAVRAGAALGMATIGFTGGDGGDLGPLVDIGLVVAASATAHIQEAHLALIHVLCESVERALVEDHRPEPIRRGANDKILSLQSMVRVRNRLAEEGRKVVWTNGCFDILHPGHVASLAAAKRLGDVLIVGLNGDDAIRRLKGAGRPVFPANDRAQLLAALACVDYVVIFEELTPVAVLEALRPDVHCKGGDYAGGDKSMPELASVQAYGGEVTFGPYLGGYSTSTVIQRIREGAPGPLPGGGG